jgi:PAS domain S-box-containing protein
MGQDSAEPIRVLHVDNEPDFSDLTAEFLARESEQFAVDAAESAAAGLDRLAGTDYDCVVSDYEMPGRNGVEFLRTVREEHPELPFILYTGRGSEAVASEAISAGVTDYLQKETGTEQYAVLANRIENAVGRQRTERELELKNRAIEEAPVGITLTDPTREDNPLVYANEAFLEITGYGREQVDGWNHRQLQGPETRPEPVAELREAIDASEPTTVELRNYRADGIMFWNRVTVAPLRDDSGEVVNWLGFQQDVTARREREQELERYEGIVETMADTAAVLDRDRRFEVVNGRLAELYGSTPEALRGEKSHLLEALAARHDGPDPYDELVAGDRSEFRAEIELEYPEHGTRVTDIRMTRLADEDGTFSGVVAVGRDVTARKRYAQALSALHDATSEFAAAGTTVDTAEHVVTAMVDVAGLPNATVFRYDEDRGVLQPVAQCLDDDQPVEDLPAVEPGEGLVWDAFTAGETVHREDTHGTVDGSPLGPTISSELIVPLGEHGVIVAVDPEPAAFDGRDRELAEIVATAAETALDSVTQTERLRERKAELDDQASRLHRVNQLNDAIRSVNRGIVAAESHEVIRQTVCDRIADLDVIDFAWVGEPDPDANRLSPAAWAGADRGYLDALDGAGSIGEDSDGTAGEAAPGDPTTDGAGGAGAADAEPAVRAARNRAVAHVPNVAGAVQSGDWRTAALQQGYTAVLSLPFTYGKSLYGVLTVYAGTRDVFDEAFREVLAELGELVGLGMNAIDRRDALLGRRHTAVELALDGSGEPAGPFLRLADRLDCEVELSTILPREGSTVVYARCAGVTRGEIAGVVDGLAGIEDVRRVRGTDPCDSGCLFEFVAGEAGLASRLAEQGVRSQSISFDGGDGRIVATLPSTVEPSALVADLGAEGPGISLAATEVEREAVAASDAFLLTDALTDAQREAVEAAHEAGFFAWPRDSTSEEIATALGISQPAFSQRLRAAQGKVFDAYCRGTRLRRPGNRHDDG